MGDIKILSMNCRGLPDLLKRRDVLNHLRTFDPSIPMLQDINLDSNSAERMILEWGFEGLIAPHTTRARGVAISFNNNFEYDLHSSITDPDGNFLLDISFGVTKFTVGNVYGPNDDNPTFHDAFLVT